MVGTRAMATECISQTRVHAYRVHVDGNTTYGAIAHRCMPIGCVPIGCMPMGCMPMGCMPIGLIRPRPYGAEGVGKNYCAAPHSHKPRQL
jgi:hypothetical protein